MCVCVCVVCDVCVGGLLLGVNLCCACGACVRVRARAWGVTAVLQ